MPSVTNDQIRDISVSTVESFLNDKIPLSQGLAKQASLHQLNAEQINRCVEATNSIAHLKIISLSDDRTVEFPLCKAAEVMAHIVDPGTEKIATFKEEPVFEKVASTELTYADFLGSLSEHERTVMFQKEAQINARKLEMLQNEADNLLFDLTKQAGIVAKDPEALEKIAVACEDSYEALSTLVFGEVKHLERVGLFKEAELKEERKLHSLYKRAQDLVAEKAKIEGLNKVAMEKQAMFGAIAGMAGRAVGAMGTMGIGAVKTVGRGITNAVGITKGSNPLAGMAVKGVGYGVLGGAIMHGNPKATTDMTTGASKGVWESLHGNN